MNIDSLQTDLLSDSSDNLEILFLDTFSSQSIEDRPLEDTNRTEFNVGLVQFSNPVIIHELRIIPLSTLVSAESLKGVRLGATIPSSFDVHFYLNDLKAKEAPTFLDIGSFSYKEHDRFIYKPLTFVPTDGLFLRGHFESLTLAVLGISTDISTLVQSNKAQSCQPNTVKSSNDIKDIDENSNNIEDIKKPIELKEPDEAKTFNELSKTDNVQPDNGKSFYNDGDNSKSDHFVIKEEVHSLSPSPDNTRIRSPSPQHNLSPAKSNSSRSPSTVKSNEKIKNYLYDKSKCSPSPLNSTSPNHYSSKSRIEHSSLNKSYRRSRERDRDEPRSSTSHFRSRYDDDAYNYNDKYRSRRSRDRSPDVRSSSNYHSSRYSRRSRSKSKESPYSRSHYSRSSHRGLERHGKDSHSRSSSRDNRSVNSDFRDDNRSVFSVNSRTRSSGGNYDYNNDIRDRDISPKSTSSSKHKYSSVKRLRRSKSITPVKSKSYHSHDLYSPGGIDSPARSPTNKKSRTISSHNISSPNPSLTSKNNNFVNKNNSIRSLSRSTSPNRVMSKIVVDNIASPVSHNDDDFIINDTNLSPIDVSTHSSLSIISLKSDAKANRDNGSIKSNNPSIKSQPNSVDNPIELFEPLSPMDDLSDLETDNNVDNSNDDNYEQISLSSDAEMENGKISLDDSFKNTDELQSGEQKADLEIISSDEEYVDELNTVLPSDKIDYADYLGIAANNDDEMDNAFDTNKNLFDPFLSDQLKSLKFRFNCNNSSNFIDNNLMNVIIKFVDDNFVKSLSVDDYVANRKDIINEAWVENVKQLANEIMELSSSAIFYSFDAQNSSTPFCDHDLERLSSILILIVKDGLNFDLAISQKQLLFKVRHLKSGIKLLIALLSSFDLRSKTSNFKLSDLIFESNILYDLLILYNKPFMSLSLRLLILNCLIIACDYPEGVDYLYNKQLDWFNVTQSGLTDFSDNVSSVDQQIDLSQLTSYQYILTLFLTQQKSPLTTVFEELLDKIHLFDLFKTLSKINSEDLAKLFDADMNSGEDSKNGDLNSNVPHSSLVQIVSFFKRLSQRIRRPFHFLSNIFQYEIKTAVHTSNPMLLLSSSNFQSSISNLSTDTDCFNCIKIRLACKHISCSSSKFAFVSQKSFYTYLRHFDTLNLIVDLLKIVHSSFEDRSTKHQQELFELCSYLCDILLPFLDSISSQQQGLIFLLENGTNTDFTNSMHECFIKFNNIKFEFNESDDNRIQLRNKLVNFGVKFITRLYAFSLVDNILSNIYHCLLEEIKKPNSRPGSSIINFLKTENSTVVESLFRLYTMIYLDKFIFRDSVISILTMDHNFDAIISFILPIISQSNALYISNEKIANLGSISFIYASKIAAACIHYLPEANLLHFHHSYGQILGKNIENVQSLIQQSTLKLHKNNIFQSHILKFLTLSDWIPPIKSVNLHSSEELTIMSFVKILKKHNDLCRDKFNSIDNYINRIFYFEPELITVIKHLASLCDPSSDYANNQDLEIQYKYNYLLVHCYSHDCISFLITLLEAICETCLRPSHQTYAYSFNETYNNLFLKSEPKITNGSESTIPKQPHSLQQKQHDWILHQGSLIIEFIRPSVRLVKIILSFIISSMGNTFNDSTPIPVLLRIYNFLDYYKFDFIQNNRFPQVDICTKSYARAIQKEIIDIMLSVYTRIYVENADSEEACKKSIWNKLLKHVFDFITESPKNFVSGLDILLQILPKPLPFSTNQKMTETEIAYIINFRKLWSAHLHFFNSEIEEMVNYLILCDSLPVQTNLRYVCYKLCDLFTPTVITLSKSITEFLVHNVNIVLKVNNNSKETEQIQFNDSACKQLSQKHSLNNCIKILSFILDLFSKSIPFRIGILNALYYFGNADIGRKNSSKIYHFVSKLFDFLNQKKLDKEVGISADSLFKTILSEGEIDLNNDLSSLITKYFCKNNSPITYEKQNFQFPEKLASKFMLSCSESLNDYFNKRSVYSTGEEENCQIIVNNELPCNDNGAQKPDNDIDTIIDNKKEEIKIYCPAFIELSKSASYPSEWPSLAAQQTDDAKCGIECDNFDFIELSKKYFRTDMAGLSKTFETLYSPIVVPPEPVEEKNNDDSANSMPQTSNKRISGRGRGRIYRMNDPFRSRPPNTSRPPSMHVDDFVALEKRHDPIVVKNNNRPSHSLQLHVNTGLSLSHSNSNNNNNSHNSSYSSKHSEYLRKKNVSSHNLIHSHSHLQLSPYPNYQNLKTNNINSASNSQHFNKQP